MYRSIEIAKLKSQRDKRIEVTHNSISDVWQTCLCKICVVIVPEVEVKGNEAVCI